MTKYEIFPTPVWHIEGAPQRLVDELYKGAYDCRDNVESNSLSNIGGYQSASSNDYTEIPFFDAIKNSLD